MDSAQVDWKRMRHYLLAEGHKSMSTPYELDLALSKLEGLCETCGEFSGGRRMLQRIGASLLKREQVTIVAPTCPDYSHKNGVYTFRSLSGGVSLLAEQHIRFLKRIVKFFEPVDVMFLVADHEADDSELCRVVGKSQDEFLELVLCSVEATRRVVEPLGWTAYRMTSAIADLVEREQELVGSMSSNGKFSQRITAELAQRMSMYRKINPWFTIEQMRERTIKTAAQYVALGNWADRNGFLICNHTTTNLSWYLQTEVAVLHNPVSVY